MHENMAMWYIFKNTFWNIHWNVVTQGSSKCSVLIGDIHHNINPTLHSLQNWGSRFYQFIVQSLLQLEVLQRKTIQTTYLTPQILMEWTE